MWAYDLVGPPDIGNPASSIDICRLWSGAHVVTLAFSGTEQQEMSGLPRVSGVATADPHATHSTLKRKKALNDRQAPRLRVWPVINRSYGFVEANN
ncbi:MAG: hypothetical protein OXB90_10375 [Acidimicrobiaceae bacterium]|nr:hypothetical protein [Acidimicrobiaceae bacterium]